MTKLYPNSLFVSPLLRVHTSLSLRNFVFSSGTVPKLSQDSSNSWDNKGHLQSEEFQNFSTITFWGKRRVRKARGGWGEGGNPAFSNNWGAKKVWPLLPQAGWGHRSVWRAAVGWGGVQRPWKSVLTKRAFGRELEKFRLEEDQEQLGMRLKGNSVWIHKYNDRLWV